jgi:hypothetical protein
MNKTNFKLALGVFVENEENFEIKEIFNFICENSPFFETELKKIKNISLESGVQFKSQLKAMLNELNKKIETEKLEDSQLKQLYIKALTQIVEKY